LPRVAGHVLIEPKVVRDVEVRRLWLQGIDLQGADAVEVEGSNALAQMTKAHQRPDASPHCQPVGIDAAARGLTAARRVVGKLDRLAGRAGVPKLLELWSEILLQRRGNRSPLHPHPGRRHLSAGEETYLSKRVRQIGTTGESARGQRRRPRRVQDRHLLGGE